MKKKLTFKERIPVLIFILFVALAVFATKNIMIDAIFIGIGLIGYFISKSILNKK